MQGIRVAVAAVVGFWCAGASADVTVRGRVTDKEGKPVAEAQVFCLKPARINSPIESVDGKSDAQGLFAVTLAGFDKATDLKNESVLVYAEGHGLGVTTAGALLEAPANGPAVTVSLPAATEKTYRVLDPQGRPVAGALIDPVNYRYGSHVAINYGPGMKLPETLMPVLGGTTDELGVVRFTSLIPDKLVTIQVVSDDYGQQEVGNPGRIETIPLRPTARVVVVFDRTQGKLGKCSVVAYTASLGGGPFAPPAGPGLRPREASSVGVHYSRFVDDPEGIDIPKIADGLLNFRLSHSSNEQPVLPVWPARVELAAGTTRTIEVQLQKTVTIHGRVVDREAKPCINVPVTIGTPSDKNVIITSTDAEGRYHCNVLKGAVTVTATGGGLDQWFGGRGPSTIRRDVESDLELPDYVLASEGSQSLRPSR